MKTPLQEFMEYMDSHQYFIGNDLLSKYKELLDKEKQELKDAFDMGVCAWASGCTFEYYYNETYKDTEQ